MLPQESSEVVKASHVANCWFSLLLLLTVANILYLVSR